jgi:hypothetical protein
MNEGAHLADSNPAYAEPKLSRPLKVGRLARRPLTFRGAEDANRSGGDLLSAPPLGSVVNSDGT